MTFCSVLGNFRFTTAFVCQIQECVHQRKLLHLANCASVQQNVEQHEWLNFQYQPKEENLYFCAVFMRDILATNLLCYYGSLYNKNTLFLLTIYI